MAKHRTGTGAGNPPVCASGQAPNPQSCFGRPDYIEASRRFGSRAPVTLSILFTAALLLIIFSCEAPQGKRSRYTIAPRFSAYRGTGAARPNTALADVRTFILNEPEHVQERNS